MLKCILASGLASIVSSMVVCEAFAMANFSLPHVPKILTWAKLAFSIYKRHYVYKCHNKNTL